MCAGRVCAPGGGGVQTQVTPGPADSRQGQGRDRVPVGWRCCLRPFLSRVQAGRQCLNFKEYGGEGGGEAALVERGVEEKGRCIIVPMGMAQK